MKDPTGPTAPAGSLRYRPPFRSFSCSFSADPQGRPESVGEFLGFAGRLLADREAEHNLILGLCHTLVHHPEVYPESRFAVVTEGGRAVAVAMQTTSVEARIERASSPRRAA